jgi:hypothetical protein
MKRSAIIGGIIWCGLFGAAAAQRVELDWIELLFLLAPLVIVPLGLRLTRDIEASAGPSAAERIARAIQLPCALIVVISFHLAPGIAAAGLASTWLAFSGMLALDGLIRLIRGAHRNFDSAFAAVAFLYLPVGAAWLCASRFGLRPFGFEEPIVLLTAVHFHYAGYAAQLLARSSRRAAMRSKASPTKMAVLNVIVTGVMAGPALLAAGFVIGPRVKLAGAIVVAASEMGLALSFLWGIGRISQRGARWLIGLAAASVAFAMVLAGVWAVGEFPLQPFVHLAEMAQFHGTANAFGFTLCGLLGWSWAAAGTGARREEP